MNRLCLAAEVPLVESGTTGFLGQVIIFIRSFNACIIELFLILVLLMVLIYLYEAPYVNCLFVDVFPVNVF